MSDKETKHELLIDPTNMKVTIIGRLLGTEYGAVISLLTGTVEWLKDIQWQAPLPDAVPPKKETSNGCPGCHNGVMKLIRGGMGWAKSALKIDQAPPEVGQERQSICESCPSNCYDFGVCRDDWPNRPKKEQGCGCILALKVTQNREECPHKHWLKHDA